MARGKSFSSAILVFNGQLSRLEDPMPVLAAKKVVPVTIVSPDFYGADFQALGSTCQLRYKADSFESAREFYEDVICWVNNFEARYSRYNSSSRSEEHTSELQSPCNLVCRL